MLLGAAAGVAAATIFNGQAVHAEAAASSSLLKEYFSILATGEALFTTFYTYGVNNHKQLGINGDALVSQA